MPTVVVTETLDAVCADWLAARARLVWARQEQNVSLDEHLAEADGMVVRTYTQVTDALLAKAPRLKVVGRAGVGLDNIDGAACRRRGIAVVYTPDANTQAVVEYVLGLILDDLRPRYTMQCPIDPATFHELRKVQVGRQLDQLTVGILGFGRIGKRLGQALHALGVHMLVNDLLPEAELRKAVSYPFQFVDKAHLYAHSDVLTIHVDGRAENRQMIDAAVLGRLKPDCLIVNAARGMLVDAEALAAWARATADKGGRAILDVHDPEPPVPEYPLFNLANVRLLPHLASRTDTALENMSWVVKDVAAVLEGLAPTYPAP